MVEALQALRRYYSRISRIVDSILPRMEERKIPLAEWVLSLEICCPPGSAHQPYVHLYIMYPTANVTGVPTPVAPFLDAILRPGGIA